MFGTSKRVPSQLKAAAVFPSVASTIVGIAVISGMVNLLALTAPIFMLQVYDRVLSSRSIPTLVGLSVLALGMYAFQAALEIIRSRVLVRVGERFDHALSGSVFQGIVRLPLETKMPGDGLQPLRDLDNVRAFLSSPAPTAIFDLPWMPFYLAICFLFDFWLGATALVGAILLIAITIITDRATTGPTRDATQSGIERNALTESARRNAETVRALGLNERFERRWREANQRYLGANRKAADIANGFGSVSRAIRIILQSAILAVGAWLVVEQRVSGGVMIASSIMMGRALAPVDLAIGSWKPFLMARQSWGRLRDLFALVPREPEVTELPRPQHSLSVEAVTVAPPGGRGKPTVTGISFSLVAGSALGIIGPSGSGKSTLIRVLVGAWMPISGHIRFDGASLEQWNRAALGRDIGYLSQSTDLFDGTIAANIARFDPQASAEDIVAAAKDAGVHDAILKMEKGYETAVGEGGSALSAGQRQRVGLARALYKRPFLVVLDEPNANLDAEGEASVIRAIAGVRERGGIAIVVAHRPSAVEAVDHLMIVDGGRASAFGRRDDVLSQIMRKAPAGPGGFSASGRSVTPLRVIPGHNPSEDIEDSNRTLSDADK